MIYNTIAVVQSNENNHYCVWANLQAVSAGDLHSS